MADNPNLLAEELAQAHLDKMEFPREYTFIALPGLPDGCEIRVRVWLVRPIAWDRMPLSERVPVGAGA